MQNLLLLFTKHGATVVFVLLEILCFYLMVHFNRHQNDIFLHSSNVFSGKVYHENKRIREYLSLREVNDSLALEVSKLKKRLLLLEGYGKQKNIDSLGNLEVISAKVINQTINLYNNYITINKGEKDGVKEQMGVIGNNGVVGIVTQTSENYATILSVLNTISGVSAKIKEQSHFGVLTWDPGSTYNTFNLEAIPKHATIEIGDSIITSGFSTIFPPDIFIGKISNFDFKKGNSNYNIEVKTKINLTNLEYVYLIKNDDAEEIKSLEERIE